MKKSNQISTEIHSGLTKNQALDLMKKGHKISHRHYTDDEFLQMVGGEILDEKGYRMGNEFGDFWMNRQKWETDWMTFNAR